MEISNEDSFLSTGDSVEKRRHAQNDSSIAEEQSGICCKSMDCCGHTCCSLLSFTMWTVCASYIPVGYIGVSLGAVLQIVLIDLGVERTLAEDGITLASAREAFFSASLFVAAGAAAALTQLIISIGRFKTLYLGYGVLCVGAIQCAIAEGYWTYTFGRIVEGCGLGVLSVATPVLIAELSPRKKRDFYGALGLFASATGILLGSVLGLPASTPPVGVNEITGFDAWYWRFMQASNLILAMAIVIPTFLLKIPETPLMLILQRKDDEAKNILRRLYRNKLDFEQALREVHEAAGVQRQTEKAGIGICQVLADKGGLSMTFLSSFLLMLHDLSGVGVAILVASKLLLEAGINPDFVSYTSLLVGLAQIVGCIPAILLSPRFGSRNMIRTGYIICFSAFLPTAITFWAAPNWVGLPWMTFTSFMIFMIGYRVGSGSLGWSHITQGSPTIIRGKITGVAMGALWTTTFLIVMFSQFIPIPILFTVLAGTNGVALIFAFTALKDLRNTSPESSPYFKNKGSQFFFQETETTV